MAKLELYTTKEIRELLKMSQQEMADVIRCSREHYSKLESGKRRWTIDTGREWFLFVIDELEEVENVEWGRIPEIVDLNQWAVVA